MKRLLVFLLLLVFGGVGLWLAIGDEQPARANGAEPPRQMPPSGPGIPVAGGGVGTTLSGHGQFHYPKRKPVALADGTVRHEPVYVLDAEDSEPLDEGLQRLIDVTLQLFDDGVHVATLRADQAFVQLGRGPNGEASLDEQKSIDVRGARLDAEKGSELEGLALQLGDALIDVDDDLISLTTERDQPVSLTMAGERPMSLTGRGAQARFPRGEGTSLKRADIEILQDPVLESEEARIRARGRLHYVEDTTTGAAHVTLEDDVLLELTKVDFALPGMVLTPGGNERSLARGDTFSGWLVRPDERRDQEAPKGPPTWLRMNLHGAPATVDVPGLRLETPRLSVLSGPAGEPSVVTAHGGRSVVRQLGVFSARGQEDPVTGVSPRRIHLLRPGAQMGALHRSFGFPRWSLRALDQQQVVVFEGDSQFESGARTLRASEGFRVLRRDAEGSGIVHGFGDVSLRQRGEPAAGARPATPDLVATGHDGLMLVADGEGQRLVLGPHQGAPGWTEHRYEVRYGDATLTGRGSCVVDQHGDDTTLALDAPLDEIEGAFPGNGLLLRRVRQLRCALGKEQLERFDVTGLPVHATLTQAEESVLVRTPRLTQIGPRSLRLLPMPAEEAPWSQIPVLDRTPHVVSSWLSKVGGKELGEHTIEVTGPSIDVHHAGGRNVTVEAVQVDGDLPRIYARVPQRGSEPTTVTCSAERLRILPFVLTPELRRTYLGGAHGPLADVLHHSVAQPWLLVDRVHDFALDDERQGHVEGTGDRLLIAQGGKAALFIGDPDGPTPAVVTRTFRDRTVRTQGARVRVYEDDAVRLVAMGAFEGRSTFLRPTMTLHTADSHGLLAHMRSECGGNIQIDPDAVRFDGPVEVQGLTEEGELDPEGVFIAAEHLHMPRRDGDVVAVIGRKVSLDWTQMSARAAELDLDLVRGRCLVRDPVAAEIDLADGHMLRSPRIEVDYRTWAISMARGRTIKSDPSQEHQR